MASRKKASGNQGKGRLTGETFASGPSQSVTGGYAYTYDARGRQTGWTMTLGSTSYPFSTSYNDAGQATSLTYPDGDVVTTSYSAQDWLAGVSETKGGTTNTLLNTVSYTGANGAAQLPTQATVDNGVYTWNLTYDSNLRLTENKVKQVSNNSTPFDQTRTFDNAGNVVTTNTQITGNQTDHQVFCYDEQNRLVWAGSTGTPSCGTTLTPGTLNSQQAQYTQTYAYDVLNRLTQGPLGAGYTYGDTNHLDAVTSAAGYSASYDAAGDMTGRNGQVLGYDALRRLISWQNTATNPTQTASYAYDGAGNRVQQAVTTSGTTTTTSYIGSYEEVSVTGGTTTTTKYYSAGVATVVNVNGTLTYLVADALSSVSVALTAAGGVQATSLYAPYGSVRYSSGTMPTSYGYTKMRQDPSGLSYDQARYYDASVGQFISADMKQGPNRFGYVAGNPETLTDPTGTMAACADGDCSYLHPAYYNQTHDANGNKIRPTIATTTGSGGSGGNNRSYQSPYAAPCSIDPYGASCAGGNPPVPPKPTSPSPSSSDCPTGHKGVCFSGSGNGLISNSGGSGLAGGSGHNAISGRGEEGLADLIYALTLIKGYFDGIYQDVMGALTGGGVGTLLAGAFGLSKAAVIAAFSTIGAFETLAIEGGYYYLIHKEKELVDGLIGYNMNWLNSQLSYDMNHDTNDNKLYTITEKNIGYSPGIQVFSFSAEYQLFGLWGAILIHGTLPGFQQYGNTWASTVSA